MKTIRSLSNISKKFDKLIELLDSTSVGLWEMTPSGDMTFYNENFYKKFNIPTVNSTLDDWVNIVHEDDRDMFSGNVDSQLNSRIESFKSEYRIFDRDSNLRWIEAQGIAQFDNHGKMTEMVGSHTDVTDRKEYSNRLFNLAYIDPVTGLFNKKMLVETIEQDLDNSRRSTLVLFDFYLSKQLISIYGQDFANKIFCEGCKILQDLINKDTKLFRISIGKYAAVIPGTPDSNAIQDFASLLRAEMLHLRDAFSLRADPEFTTATLAYPLPGEALSAADVIDRCLLTIEDATKIKPGSIVIYNEETRQRVLKSIHIETNMLTGLRNGEFFNMYQPIVNTQSRDIKSFETLVRWNSDEWGTIYPDDFIHVAEKNKRIIALGQHILENALIFISQYNERHNTSTNVSVNVSVIELLETDYADKVIALLEKYNVDSGHLTLEITESIMMDQATFVTVQLNRLKDHGVGIALDDFGTGYASLNNMIFAPITEVKIDRQIMKELMNNELIRSFMHSFVLLCHGHKASVVAEGIEDESMAETAQYLGVDKLQGYMFAKPMTADKAINFTNMFSNTTKDDE